MKKICRLCVVGILISMVCFMQNVKADSLERLKDSEDYNTVFSMAESMIDNVNDGGPVHSTGGGPAVYEDIDFDHAIKEYLDTPLIEDKIIKYDDVKKALQESRYMWIVPIRADGYLYEACMSKRLDANGQFTGEWDMDVIYAYEETDNLTLEEQLDISLERNSIEKNAYELFLVGGVAPIRHPMFIALDENGISMLIPARASAAAMITDSSKPANDGEVDEDEYTEDDDSPFDPDGFQAYDYKAVMNAAKSEIFSIGYGGGMSEVDLGKKHYPYGLYIVIAVIVCGAVGIVIRYRKKSRKG